MKKLMVTGLLVAGIGFAASAQVPQKKAPQTKEEMKANFLEQCKANMPDAMGEEAINKFCNCTADNAIDKMSIEELAQLNPENDAQPSEELQAKMMELMAPCMSELEAAGADAQEVDTVE